MLHALAEKLTGKAREMALKWIHSRAALWWLAERASAGREQEVSH
jgi:hypothetical protein